MKKFTTTAALMLALSASGASAQGYDTNCTRNYLGDVTCKTNPSSGSENSYIDLMGFQRGAELANTQNQNDYLRQQNMLMQQHMMQQQQQQYLEHMLQQQQYLEQLLRCQRNPQGLGC